MQIQQNHNLKLSGLLGRAAISAAAFCVLSAHAETFTVYNDATGDSYVRLGQPNGIGDIILWNSDMQTLEGDVVGTGSGHCTQIDVERNYFCTFVIDLTDRGMISGQGVQKTEPRESTYPITGGTGDFIGIVGEMKSRPVENRDRFSYLIEYQRPSRD